MTHMERRRREKSIDEVREEKRARAPRPEESDLAAATGLFQPSEDPRLGSELPPQAQQATYLVTRLRDELEARRTTDVRQGQVEGPGEDTRGDLVVGPDIGDRPHRPGARSTR
jgi:hypothetical protein